MVGINGTVAASFNPLNRGGDIQTTICLQILKLPPEVSILLIEAGIFRLNGNLKAPLWDDFVSILLIEAGIFRRDLNVLRFVGVIIVSILLIEAGIFRHKANMVIDVTGAEMFQSS